MSSIDRLSTLIERFSLSVTSAPAEDANLAVLSQDGAPDCIRFLPQAHGFAPTDGHTTLTARVSWGGTANPLLSALPELVMCPVDADEDLASLVTLLRNELAGQRCGAPSVVNRLGEVLIVRLLRSQIEQGSTDPGLLAGLADPRLSRAIVAIHDAPERLWRNEDLAQIAGLSRSRFAETFQDTLGQTPAAYLRHWRLTLAHQDLIKGHRIDAVARRYGYESPEGFARAYRRNFGTAPSAAKRAA